MLSNSIPTNINTEPLERGFAIDSTSSDGSIPPPPPTLSSQKGGFEDDKLTEIYKNMSSASRLQLDKLPREEQLDVLKKVYHKRSGEGLIENEDNTDILEVEELKPDNEDSDNDGGNSFNDAGSNTSSSGSGGSKKVSFDM